MEEELRTVNEEYVEARVIEALDDLYLALILWKEGRTRNAAGKAFNAVKALLSALVVANGEKLAKLAKDEKQREWIKRKGHAVPTHSMNAIAEMLSDVGIDLTDLVNRALNLHDYQYNGFEPDFSKYSSREEVPRDLVRVVRGTKDAVEKYFPRYALKELGQKVKALLEELSGSNTPERHRG
mgnify:CR=1 FL=1